MRQCKEVKAKDHHGTSNASFLSSWNFWCAWPTDSDYYYNLYILHVSVEVFLSYLDIFSLQNTTMKSYR